MSKMLIVVIVVLILAGSIIGAFLIFGKQMTEEELFNTAKDKFGQGAIQESIDLYQELMEKYPESQYLGDAVFMIGYLNANHLQDYATAKIYYERLIAEFPDHGFVPSAQFELEHLGKSPEDLEQLLQDKINKAEQAGKTGEKIKK
ncbi:tol-pal system YbgF family protein [candidate division KSB1 bacterium]